MSEATQKLEELLKDQPSNPLRPHQARAYREESRRLREIVNAPQYVSGVDRGAAAKKARETEEVMTRQLPKPLIGETQDQVAKLAQEVMDGDIRPAMLTKEEMWRNPAGAVGHYLKKERHPITKAAIHLWKRAMLTLEPQSDDPDQANIERFRPEKMLTGTSTFMADAQIPGKFAMTPQAKEHWPLGEPTADTALKQVQEAEVARHRMTGKKV